MQTIFLEPEQTNVSPMRAIAFADELNAEQLRVVEGGEGPCLVLAGAGSGKTRTITYRVAWLLAHGVAPQSILLLTFTNKAAGEMVRRVEQLLGSSVRGMWGGTFHALANRILRQYADLIGFTPNFTILDAEDARSLIKVCAKEYASKDRAMPSPAVIGDVLSFQRNAQIPLLDALERKQPGLLPFQDTFSEIASAYAARKRAGNAMDFDDLLCQLLRLLTEQPAIARRLSEQFRYILVDEYQDTNPVQAAIVDAFAAVHRNILVVGDDAQSIYSFRAASVENILTFPDRYPDATVYRLEMNYRSTPEILSVANDVISKNTRQFPKALKPVRDAFAKPLLVPTGSAAEEAAFVAEKIAALERAGTSTGNIAVLFRAAHHSQELEFQLAKRGMQYEYRGGMKFFERSHVKDVIAFLKLRTNPKDGVAWLRALTLQEGIGETGAARIAERLSAVESLATLSDADVQGVVTPRSARGWADLREIVRRVTAAETAAAAVRAVATSSYVSYLEREYPNAQDRLDDLEQFATFAEQYTSLDAFLTEVTLKEDFGAPKEGAEIVSQPRLVLSTIHQAKGLEWDAVFIIRLAQGSFPHSRASAEEAGLEEERRLFYVAVTRARRELFLTYPATAGYDSLVLLSPSIFLDELRRSLIEPARLLSSPPVSHYRPTVSYHTSVPGSYRPSRTVFRDTTETTEEDTIVEDALGERTMSSPRRRGSLLRDV
jgi:DNA helicase-2/ATP-dependent DNA helicase PcrA